MSFANGLGKEKMDASSGGGGGGGGGDIYHDNDDGSDKLNHFSVASLHVPSMAVTTLLTGVSSMCAASHPHPQEYNPNIFSLTWASP